MLENAICYNSTVPSSPPLNVMVTSVDPSSLMVSWDPPVEIDRNGPITGYVIQYTRVGSSDMMSVNVDSGTTHTISGLVLLAEYLVTVAAMTVNGTGQFSDAVTGMLSGYGEFSKTLLSRHPWIVGNLFILIYAYSSAKSN